METYNRPLTPPDNDRKTKVPDVEALQKKQEQIFPPVDTDSSNPFHQERLSSSQPPPPGYKLGTAFPFEKNHAGISPPSSAKSDFPKSELPKPDLSNKVEVPKLDDSPIHERKIEPTAPVRQRAPLGQEPKIDPFHPSAPFSQSGPLGQESDRQKSEKRDHSTEYGSQRNETTHRIETEVLNILQWKNPVRSGSVLALIVGTILLTRSYSLLQIGAMGLSLAIGINLIYVHFMLQGQRVLSQDHVSHPYRDVIDDERSINRQSVRHYTNVFIELSETLIRGLTRIVFIDNTKTSIKWLAISFVVWKVSAHISAITLVLLLTLSAFTFPRLYISNKDVVDAHIHRGQQYIQTGLNKAQVVAKEGIQDTYVKARSMAAQAGTTGTDAKNTMKNASVVEKQD
ncbi:hypothetical protein G6F56_002138 [Rhizopus delemar]|uniref:Reticulon-like protein n=1 Tax=Rhizopus stolonifer TaxID=4846 RepID=A0A367KXC6_RHIST|nr:hypothetical protein G6F56_002138 [Rhizopus delemar]RCI06845.1 Reticulon-like protein [Rhizopus stolonifer]